MLNDIDRQDEMKLTKYYYIYIYICKKSTELYNDVNDKIKKE